MGPCEQGLDQGTGVQRNEPYLQERKALAHFALHITRLVGGQLRKPVCRILWCMRWPSGIRLFLQGRREAYFVHRMVGFPGQR